MNFNTKRLLKEFDKDTIKKVLKISELNELEYWVLYYSIVEKRMVENTCAKLSIGRTYYFILQKLGLLKVSYTLKRVINL